MRFVARAVRGLPDSIVCAPLSALPRIDCGHARPTRRDVLLAALACRGNLWDFRQISTDRAQSKGSTPSAPRSTPRNGSAVRNLETACSRVAPPPALRGHSTHCRKRHAPIYSRILLSRDAPCSASVIDSPRHTTVREDTNKCSLREAIEASAPTSSAVASGQSGGRDLSADSRLHCRHALGHGENNTARRLRYRAAVRCISRDERASR